MKNLLPGLLLIVALTGCKKNSVETNPITKTEVTAVDTTVKLFLESKSNNGNIDSAGIQLSLVGDSVNVNVPGISTNRSFVLSFEPVNANLKVNGVSQKSGVTVNDFTQPVIYTYTNPNGEAKNIKVSITNFTGIPILFLNTSAPVVSEDDYVTGSLNINVNGQFATFPSNVGLNIKGRGNTTWAMPKKPYRIKFNNKQSMLGLPAAKNWVLLANYSDKSLLRNAVAFDMGHQFGADFTPHYRFVEVVMNGVYQGGYTLTEQVEVDPNRVNINELSTIDNDDSNISGGYLLELDQRLDADYYFYSNAGLPFTISDPDAITAQQLAYIDNYVQQTEDAIFADNFADPVNGYTKYINVDSFIDWYLVKELMKDNDADDFSSIYYYKDLNGKLGMGPVWDFDIAAGNYVGTESNDPTGWWVRNAHWFSRLFQDPAFNARVKQRWQALQPTLPLILNNIDKNAAYLNLSQQQNFATWPILNVYVWPNSQIAGSYQGEIDYLKSWLKTRIDWMNANM
ncbi:CotH kinase family protein [Mucilaginibacter sp. dw_454]|uniref:CotH kinase family protein n=1 Tax=Mucilaginibacter sp. dw_454 TaxID=2720079 RepID=UPI001BD5EA47|nr:CotH kinase family protein [Mucilaginibacter sp. dw_454]